MTTAIIECADQHQHAGTEEIEQAVRHIGLRNKESEANASVNGNTANERDNALMLFPCIRLIN